MTASIVFQIVNTIVIPAWLILIFFPGKSWRNPVIYGFSMAMAAVYLVYIIKGFGDLDMTSFSKLEGIKAMFSSDEAVLTGWVHYLVFDLLVGNWILNQSRKHGLNHFLIIPCLLLCFMFGPVGFLLYSILKVSKTKQLA
ncbi:MAG: ABA4-like family protein [Psychroflexus sp.]